MNATTSWAGTISNVEYRHQPKTEDTVGQERYIFILLCSKIRTDGSEERFEKSVDFHSYRISGGVFTGRQVVVDGVEGKDGWIHAKKIIDKGTGAVSTGLNYPIVRTWLLSLVVILVLASWFIVMVYLGNHSSINPNYHSFKYTPTPTLVIKKLYPINPTIIAPLLP